MSDRDQTPQPGGALHAAMPGMPLREGVSVLMPLWGRDHPDRFAAAVASITREQTRPPDALILGIDGPLGPELEAEVARVERGEYGPARILRHERHRGVAAVLQDGLLACETDLVARADADDLCRPHRLERQVPVMREEELDLLGSAMQEFCEDIPPGTGPLRSRPLTQERIRAYLRVHSPFHHPSVMLRTESALAAGGYRELDHLEDYWLWERMLLAGARCANLPDVLVDYRVDSELFSRRGGWRMLASDVRLQRIMRADHVTTTPQMAMNLVRRAGYRLAPGFLRRLGYRLLVETRT